MIWVRLGGKGGGDVVKEEIQILSCTCLAHGRGLVVIVYLVYVEEGLDPDSGGKRHGAGFYGGLGKRWALYHGMALGVLNSLCWTRVWFGRRGRDLLLAFDSASHGNFCSTLEASW